MRLYTKQHKHSCGIDLHTNKMYLCILNQEGDTLLHRNIKTEPEIFLKAIAPYREDLVVCAECMFSWYWLADLCAEENIPFILDTLFICGPSTVVKARTTRSIRRKLRPCSGAA